MRKLMLVSSLMLVMAGSAAQSTALSARPTPKSVPELDGSVAALAVALIGGGLAVAHGRRRRARS